MFFLPRFLFCCGQDSLIVLPGLIELHHFAAFLMVDAVGVSLQDCSSIYHENYPFRMLGIKNHNILFFQMRHVEVSSSNTLTETCLHIISWNLSHTFEYLVQL